MAEVNRYFVLIELGAATDNARLVRDVPKIIELLDRLSNKEKEQVCRSGDGKLFGFFIKSKLPVAALRAEFEKSTHTTNKDSFLVFEVGKDFNGIGFSRAWTWLQHH